MMAFYYYALSQILLYVYLQNYVCLVLYYALL
jgi:hypothetical protein